MADTLRALEEIKVALQQPTLDLDDMKKALAELCEHLIQQKADFQQLKNDTPTRGQIVAMSMGGHV